MNHQGKRLFITGIPTSGKSYLAKILAKESGGIRVNLDDFREDLSKYEQYKKWVNFYSDQDERSYLTNTSPEDQWKNLVAQSESLWPAFIKEIAAFSEEERPVIFESVNLLPHLVKRDLDFPGIVLIGSSYDEVLKRNQLDPRWGNTPQLQELEAKTFFEVERPRYKAEAEKYGYKIYEKADDAISYGLDLLIK